MLLPPFEQFHRILYEQLYELILLPGNIPVARTVLGTFSIEIDLDETDPLRKTKSHLETFVS